MGNCETHTSKISPTDIEGFNNKRERTQAGITAHQNLSDVRGSSVTASWEERKRGDRVEIDGMDLTNNSWLMLTRVD